MAETTTTLPLRLKVLLTVAPAIIIVATLCYFSWVLADSNLQTFALNVMIAVLGITLGWVFGIFLSPLGEEKEEFSKYGRAFSVFFSGYLLAKVDPVVSKILSAESLFSDLAAFRLLAFTASFVVALLIAFGWRKYL